MEKEEAKTIDENALNNSENKEKKSKKKLIIALTIIILTLVIAGVLIFVFTNKDDDKDKKTEKQYKTLTREEYEKKVYEYGDEIYKEVESYFSQNKKTPLYSDIIGNLKIKDVECDDIKILVNGTVYLQYCTIYGYEYIDGIIYYKENDLKNTNPEDSKEFDILLSDIKPVKIGTTKYSKLTHPVEELKEVAKITNLKYEGLDLDISYTLNNGLFSLYAKDSNKADIKYDNVTKVYTEYMDCSGDQRFIIYTNSKIMLLHVVQSYEDKKLEISMNKSINNPENYEGAYSIFINSSTCGADLEYAVKTKGGEYVTIANGKKFNVDEYNYNILHFIDDKHNNYEGEEKLYDAKAMVFDLSGDNMYFYIGSDDYIYDIVDNKVTKLSGKKVKEIKGNINGFNIILEDNSLFEFNIYNEKTTLFNAALDIPGK